jgi:hypothetical protein
MNKKTLGVRRIILNGIYRRAWQNAANCGKRLGAAILKQKPLFVQNNNFTHKTCRKNRGFNRPAFEYPIKKAKTARIPEAQTYTKERAICRIKGLSENHSSMHIFDEFGVMKPF